MGSTLRSVVLVAGFAGAAALAGCGGGGGGGGGGSGGTPANPSEGDVAVMVTDAPADDIAVLDVEVLSVNLVRADGLQVAALPAKARVDFADLVSVSELISLARVPAGTYTDLSLTLNLVNAPGSGAATTSPDGAVARVVTGTGTVAARLLDTNGAEFTAPVALDVHLDPGTPLVVAPGTPRVLAIDFDLNQSAIVDLAAAPPTVRVLPLLKADVEARTPKPFRIRGPLLRTRAPDQLDLALRPHPNLAPFGSVTVFGAPGTFYEVNGQTGVGPAGFALLGAAPTGTAVGVTGTIDLVQRRFVAAAVEAGSSVRGGTLDVVEGVIVSRTASTATVRGISLTRPTVSTLVSVSYNALVTVSLGAQTPVVRRFSGNLGPDALGPGQSVLCAGTLTANTLAPAGVRIVPSVLAGTATSAIGGAPARIGVNVLRIDRLPVAAFSGLPANPWAITAAGLTSTAQAGSPVFVEAFVNTATAAFDANATTVADVTDFSFFGAGWSAPPNVSGLDSPNPSTVVVNLAGAAFKVGATAVGTPVPLGDTILMTSRPNPQGLYALRVINGPTRVFVDFGSFANAIVQLGAQGKVRRFVSAVGRFDSTSAPTQIVTHQASVTME
jgi:hypothetical protein